MAVQKNLLGQSPLFSLAAEFTTKNHICSQQSNKPLVLSLHYTHLFHVPRHSFKARKACYKILHDVSSNQSFCSLQDVTSSKDLEMPRPVPITQLSIFSSSLAGQSKFALPLWSVQPAFILLDFIKLLILLTRAL